MRSIINVIKGIVVGVATLVPGVSGGTMAIILGLYGKIIHAIGSYLADWKANTRFLAEVGIGGVIGIVAFSRLLEEAMGSFPFAMRFLFMGIIVGGIPVLYRKARAAGSHGRADYLCAAAGFAVVYFLSPEPAAAAELVTAEGFAGIAALFAAGFIMAIALVLPGISGSFVLLAFGLYGLVLGAINALDIPFLVPLAAGVAVGTFASTKAIETLLARFPAKSYMAIIGFVAGSLFAVFPGVPQGLELAASAALFVAGALSIFQLGRLGVTD